MRVNEIMTKSIVTLNSNDTVGHAADLMKNYDIGSIPVCDNEKIIGIITDRDIVLRAVTTGENTNNEKVRNIMTSNPVSINNDADVRDAARVMSERQIRRLPVVDGENLVGIVSLGDLAVENGTDKDAAKALTKISEPCSPNME